MNYSLRKIYTLYQIIYTAHHNISITNQEKKILGEFLWCVSGVLFSSVQILNPMSQLLLMHLSERVMLVTYVQLKWRNKEDWEIC
jgi:hypothetical protein